MGQQVRFRKQNVVTYAANNKIQKSLARGMVYRELMLELACAPTLAATKNTAALTEAGDEWNVIQKLEIIANGTDVIKSISGRALRWLNVVWQHCMPSLSSALADGATANPSLKSTLILPFWQFDSVKPLDTALNSADLSDLQIAVTWGDYTDINANATAFTTDPTLTVYSQECFGFDSPPVFSNYRFYEINQAFTSADSDKQIQLPVGPVYRAFTLITDDAGAEKSGILNNLKLSSGTTIFADVDAKVANTHWTDRLGISRWNGGSEALKPKSSQSSIQGVYHFDLVRDGFLTEGIDTIGFSEFLLRLDLSVVGTPNVLIVPHQIIPVRG